MLVRTPEVALWVESTPGTREPVLLVSGADSPCTHWPQELIDGLTEAGHSVLRFDQRDVGRSGTVETVYSLADLVADAIAVLDALDITRAHVLGSSMGGMSRSRRACPQTARACPQSARRRPPRGCPP